MISRKLAPLVIVEGFMSSAGALVWGNFEQHSNHACSSNGEQNRRTIFASVGPVSSLHDRACELFYSLVGGQVDYGLEHSAENGHGQFGRTHEVGLYAEWSVEHPLHFLGHSMGGPTIMKMQWLMARGFFGEKYHPDMVLSVNTISSPFRGSQLVYTLGEDTQNAPNVRPFSPGALLAKGVHVASYLSPLLPDFLDMHAEARGLSYRESTFRSFLARLWKSDWAESKDATPYDVTFEAADERERAHEGINNPNTFYRSYCATLNHEDGPEDARNRMSTFLRTLVSLPFNLSSYAIASFRFSTLRPIPAFMDTVSAAQHASHFSNEANVENGIIDVDECGGYLSNALRASDGVVPLFSQWHPYECKHTKCRHFSHADNLFDDNEKSRYETPPEAGLWHVHHLPDTHHMSVVPFWVGNTQQKAFWRDLGHWLRAIDGQRTAGTLGSKS